LSDDRNYREITAYDSMYDIINADVSQWYNGLSFPLTLKEFRDSFFSYLGVTQKEVSLIQDDLLIEKTIEGEGISGKQIITSICELNGVFGRINRNGVFDYVSLEKPYRVLTPNTLTIPGENIYPGMMIDNTHTAYDIELSKYKSLKYEDYMTDFISDILILQEEDSVGPSQGYGGNTYVIQDNVLVYGKSTDEMINISGKLLGKIKGIQYNPIRLEKQGNPCFEVGDMIYVEKQNGETTHSYILERTLTGIQSIFDSIESKGTKRYEEKVNSQKEEIRKLKSKTLKISKEVDQLVASIFDQETGLETKYEQLSDSLALSVNENGDIVSKLSVDKNGMGFVGDKVVFKTKNFNLDEEGNLSISGKYEVECVRTVYAKDYTSADLTRIQNILNRTTSPTDDDLQKYDFKGVGIDTQTFVWVSRLVNGYDTFRSFRYRITIDPTSSTSLIKTSIYTWNDSMSEEQVGSVRFGGAGINSDTLASKTVTSDAYKTTTTDGVEHIGASGTFVDKNGKTVTVHNGIITVIS
jgi:hypothetical protein